MNERNCECGRCVCGKTISTQTEPSEADRRAIEALVESFQPGYSTGFKFDVWSINAKCDGIRLLAESRKICGAEAAEWKHKHEIIQGQIIEKQRAEATELREKLAKAEAEIARLKACATDHCKPKESELPAVKRKVAKDERIEILPRTVFVSMPSDDEADWFLAGGITLFESDEGKTWRRSAKPAQPAKSRTANLDREMFNRGLADDDDTLDSVDQTCE